MPNYWIGYYRVEIYEATEDLISRRKKEEGRRKKEEGRRKKEECLYSQLYCHLYLTFN
ncbi:MAG: hypothetical protein QQW96_03580 [Tychonema bourrellyi B0820]|nr:hypothetical protein [Tychonema bourrellyi B0820]